MGGDRVPGFSTLALHAGSAAAGEGPDSAGRLEERVAALEGGTAAVAAATGLAAQLATLLVLLRPGDEFIASERMGAEATAQFARAAAEFGWQPRWADAEEPGSFERAVSPRTKAIFAATLADDGSAVGDLAALAQIAKRAQVPLVIDNTLATPCLVRPLDHGADIVIHSAGKYLGAGGEAGIVVDGGRFNWMRERRYPAFLETEAGGSAIGEAFGNFAFAVACRNVVDRSLGAGLGDAGADAILAGIETLAVRIQRQARNALAVAEHLAGHERVDWVAYPGLPGGRYYNLAQKYCPNGAGAVIGLGPAGGAEGADRLLGRTRLITRADSLGGIRSVAVTPASNGAGVPGSGRTTPPGTVRLSIGLEDLGDLLADLDEALGG